MFHDDGLEVYLKPAGDENDNIRLAEFELSESQNVEGDERTRRCAVLARHGDLKVVVRPSRDFKMHQASALIIKTNLDFSTRKLGNIDVIQRSKAHEQFEILRIHASDVAGPWRATKLDRRAITMSKVDEGERSWMYFRDSD